MSAPEHPLHLPADLGYECVQCGRSCTDFWEVPVEKAFEERLRDPRLPELIVPPAAMPVVEDSRFRPGVRVLRRFEGGRCAFLGCDKLCGIHKTLGPEVKPQTCRDFPFRYITTPAGDYVGLSFACTAVLEEKGPPVEERRAQLAAQRLASNSRRAAPGQLRLSERVPIAWNHYLAIEEDLRDILGVEGVQFPDALVAQSIYLTLLDQFVREAYRSGLASRPAKSAAPAPADSVGATSENPASTVAPPAPDPLLDGIIEPLPMTDELLATFRRPLRATQWQRLFVIARKPLEQPAVFRSVLGLVVSFRQTLVARRSRAFMMSKILATYARMALRFGGLQLDPIPDRLSWNQLRTRLVTFVAPDDAAIARRYFRHILFRKDLLLERDLRLAQGFTLMHFGLWRLYAAAHAAKEGSPRAEREHILEALRHVEQYFVFHSSFSTLFSKNPPLRNLLETAMANPRFAPTMTRAAL